MSIVLPTSEREFFLGDLDEEFQLYVRSEGDRQARRWYWRQALQAPGWWRRTSPDFAPSYAEVAKGEFMVGAIQDIRYASRSLRRSGSLVIFALAALALGIGANTAVFSVVNGILFTPLPYAEPERLVRLWDSPAPSFPELSVSQASVVDWQKENTAFEQIGGYREDGFSLSGEGVAQRVTGARVTPGLMETLDVSPLIGRWFAGEEFRFGTDRVVLLGYDLWRTRFGGDPGIVGREVRIEGSPRTVVGVMPQRFRVPLEGTELWIPIPTDENNLDNSNSLRVLGRLKTDSTIEAARTDMARVAQIVGERDPGRANSRVVVRRMDESIIGDMGSALWIALGSVGLVLLIACANVANLLLARSVSRRKEIAIRLSLGASRTRLLKQLLIESLMLALAGGVLGVGLATLGLKLLKAEAPGNIPRLAEVSIDPQVLSFAFLISIATGLLFGLMPALQSSRADLNDALKSATHSSTAGRRTNRAGRLLVIAQITIAMVVVVSSGLMLRTLWNLYATDPGFQTEARITFNVNLNSEKYAEPKVRSALLNAIIQRVRNLPGVRNVAATHRLPMVGQSGFGAASIDGRPDPKPGQGRIIIYRSITADYFDVMGIPLLRGRRFERIETERSSEVVVINQRMAAQVWPGEDPLGKHIRPYPGGPWLTVVGIVADSREVGLTQESPISMYVPYLVAPNPAIAVIVHSEIDSASLASGIRRELQSLEPDLAMAGITPLSDVFAGSMGSRKFTALLLTIFAGIAVLLAAAGIYGVLAYAVNQRIREIGVRMALGANCHTVLRHIIIDGLWLILPGIATGALGAFAATRLLSGFLFGVTAADPSTFAAIATFMIVVGVLACFIPARKAASVDPVVTLRND
jgi:predicted permease